VLWPQAAAAAKMWRVGILNGRARGDALRIVNAMRALGYVEGRDIEYLRRSTEKEADVSSEWKARLVAVAEELVRARPDAIVCFGTAATDVLQRATTTIPIVTNVGDPVRAGFAKSIVRPGGNVTGVALASAELYLKTFQHLKSIIPGDWTLAIDYGDGARDLQYQIAPVEDGARACGIAIRKVSFKGLDAKQADRALAALRTQGVRALSCWNSIAGIPDETFELALAATYGLVVAPTDEDFVAKGALMSYTGDGKGLDERKAFQLARILRGTPPGEIPFEAPTIFRLVVNLKTARILGLTIPREILLIADKVYE
jgi:putative tryptophan/tyrosine transport system substrate-binding protein